MYKFGLKLWSTNDFYLNEAERLHEEGIYQYIELYIVPGTYDKYSKLWEKLKIPFIIHAPHFKHGVNLAKKENLTENLKINEEVNKWQSLLKANTVIYHPGIGGDIKETVRQLKLINNPKIVIENKPYYTIDSSNICNGYSPEEIEYVINKTNLGFCLDIGHAICSANAQNVKPIDYIKSFLLLNPKIYHISDGDYYSSKDRHVNIGEGNYNLDDFFELILTGSLVTVETDKKSSTDLSSFVEDIEKINNILMKKIVFCPVNIDDSDLLLQWRNDPLTRIGSINSDFITKEDHNRWFIQSMGDPNRKMFMATLCQKPIGTVRFDKDANSNEWELSWTISPDMRGKGLGKLMVKSATNIFDNNLIAKVKSDNKASLLISKYSGFKESFRQGNIILFRLEKRYDF